MKKVSILIIFFCLIGCINLPKTVKEGSKVSDDKVIIVGKINITPALEQDFVGSAMRDLFKEKAFFILDADEKKMASDDFMDICQSRVLFHDAENSTTSKWGDYFVVELPRKPTYIKALYVLIYSVNNVSRGLLVRSNMKIDVSKGDRFIYIGDFNYVLNKKQKYDLTISNKFNEANVKFAKYLAAADSKNIPLQNKVLIDNSEVETISAEWVEYTHHKF